MQADALGEALHAAERHGCRSSRSHRTLGEPAAVTSEVVAGRIAAGVLCRDGDALSPSPTSARLAAPFDLPEPS